MTPAPFLLLLVRLSDVAGDFLAAMHLETSPGEEDLWRQRRRLS